MFGSLKDFHDDFKGELRIYFHILLRVVHMNMFMYRRFGGTNHVWLPLGFYEDFKGDLFIVIFSLRSGCAHEHVYV